MTIRRLIINADDFGQSELINRGIIQAHRCGIVTSTSLMVRQNATADAVQLSCSCPSLSFGLHLDLGEWRLCNGEWMPVYEVVPLHDHRVVRDEVALQLAAFRHMLGRDPTHIDSHQHVHLREPTRSIAEACARELKVPLRQCGSKIRYCGEFYGQDANGAPLRNRIAVEGLIRILEGVPLGITELCCHPAVGGDLNTMYSAERKLELEVLCDQRVRHAIAQMDIELCSFEGTRP